jgi:hypothetical protein
MKTLGILIVGIMAGLAACSNPEEEQKAAKKNYEAVTLSVEEIEKKSPLLFLSVSGGDKKNLLGQTVIKGNISNSAKMVTFKDVTVQLSFYSKTGALLMQDQEIIYDEVAPGSTIRFKSKYFSPKGTQDVAMKILSAKF